MRRKWVLLLAAVAVPACAGAVALWIYLPTPPPSYAELRAQLRKGMSEGEVEAVFGRPPDRSYAESDLGGGSAIVRDTRILEWRGSWRSGGWEIRVYLDPSGRVVTWDGLESDYSRPHFIGF
jgi:hypothetical protein